VTFARPTTTMNLDLAPTVLQTCDACPHVAALAELRRSNHDLTELNQTLQRTQEQLVQSEKLASIGQLAAGVAHEINNPVGYVFSNFSSLERYLGDLFRMLQAYEAAEAQLAGTPAAAQLAALRAEIELDYLKEDVPTLMAESREGIARVRKIVQDLKDFSHVDARREWEWADLHKGLDSTLNIVNNEIKYKADVVKQYGTLPEVQCLASEINQVFMNLLVNAAHAIDKPRGTITVRSGCADDGAAVWVEVEDDGCGIGAENLSRIFDPFFTTKPVGRGTGLGLSLSYGIVKKHCGRIEVDSAPGRGTRFRVSLPVRRAVQEPA
jgi:signal transduction histidine kinase